MLSKPNIAALTHAYYLPGKHMVLTQSNVDEQGTVQCSWIVGKLFKMQRFPVSDLLLVPSGLTDQERAEYVLNNLSKSQE